MVGLHGIHLWEGGIQSDAPLPLRVLRIGSGIYHHHALR